LLKSFCSGSQIYKVSEVFQKYFLAAQEFHFSTVTHFNIMI